MSSTASPKQASVPVTSSSLNGNGPLDSDEAPPRKPPIIPSHITWPGFVVALLMLSIIAAFQAFFAAQSDGGAQVVEAYYDAAIRFEDEQAARAASAALGWSATVEAEPCDRARCPIDVVVLDRAGAPVEGLAGRLRTSRPQRAGTVEELPLEASGAPGRYRALAILDRAGLWDFELTLHRGTEAFEASIRREIAR